MYFSATLFVQLNQGEINYQDTQEDWRNSEKHMKFWHKNLHRKDKLGNTCGRYTDNTKIDLTTSGCVPCDLTEDRVHCNHCTELFCFHTVIRYDHQVRI